MDTDFLNYFNKFTFLSFEDLKLIFTLVKIKRVKVGDVILESGAIDYNVFIVFRGLLRTYVMRADGTEITVLLSSEGMAAASSRTIVKDELSTETIVALEDSMIMIVDTQKLEELGRRHPRILLLQNKHMKRNFGDAVERIEYLTVLSPLERYLHLIEHHPELIKRVPQKYLASYMGITTESLSRVKSRISKRRI